ncbi:hypothetical protein KM043_012375 [Ampulex compressa]|nr:hypothetical protein KM043_012375 [Ampulex compressa]
MSLMEPPSMRSPLSRLLVTRTVAEKNSQEISVQVSTVKNQTENSCKQGFVPVDTGLPQHLHNQLAHNDLRAHGTLRDNLHTRRMELKMNLKMNLNRDANVWRGRLRLKHPCIIDRPFVQRKTPTT